MTSKQQRFSCTHQKGFTLIEIMVVMVIIGVMAAMAAVVVSGNKERRQLENEARKLLAILQLAQEESVFQNIEIGVKIDSEGYEFKALDETNMTWVDLSQDFLKKRRFPEWLDIEFKGEKKEIKLPSENTDSKSFRPQLLFLSSGEGTPVTLILKIKQLPKIQYKLESDGLSAIRLVEPSDDA